jgi:hypothetical protein
MHSSISRYIPVIVPPSTQFLVTFCSPDVADNSVFHGDCMSNIFSFFP